VDGVQGFLDSGRGCVSVLAVAHGFVDGFDQVTRSLEIEIDGIADVERENFVALPSDLVGVTSQVADGVADVLQARGSGDFTSLGDGHKKS
jgi:hypothetical protein